MHVIEFQLNYQLELLYTFPGSFWTSQNVVT